MLTQFDDARPAEKVKAAYEALDRIVGDSRSEEALSQTEEFQKAVQQLQETHNTLNPPKKPAAAAAPKDGAVAQVLDKAKTVAVFGSSSAKPGSPEYKAALALGAGLAQRQIQILSGGYGGLMEATSKGASATAGAVIAGVLVPTVFPQRKNGNDFLTRKIEAKSLEGRIATMVGSARAFVVLPGNLGTLTGMLRLSFRARSSCDVLTAARSLPLRRAFRRLECRGAVSPRRKAPSSHYCV